MKSIKQETLRHKEAFEYYYLIGDKRSYSKVAKEFSVSETSIKKWSQSFNWAERVVQRDIEIGKKLEEKTKKAVVNEKANYRKIVNVLVSRFVERLKANDKLSLIMEVSDLEKLIKLDLLLMGEATDRSEATEEHKFTEKKIENAYNELYPEVKVKEEDGKTKEADKEDEAEDIISKINEKQRQKEQ